MNTESATPGPGPRAACPRCGAEPGQLHALDCDVEPCPYCGCHPFGCACPGNGLDFVPMDDRMPWTGEWPGEAECREFGWYCRWAPGAHAWVRCGPNAPGATEDLNRLRREARWDRLQKRWVRRHTRRRRHRARHD